MARARLPVELEEKVLKELLWSFADERRSLYLPRTWEESSLLLRHPLVPDSQSTRDNAYTCMATLRQVFPRWDTLCDKFKAEVSSCFRSDLANRSDIRLQRLQQAKILYHTGTLSLPGDTFDTFGTLGHVRALALAAFTHDAAALCQRLPQGPAQIRELATRPSPALWQIIPRMSSLHSLVLGGFDGQPDIACDELDISALQSLARLPHLQELELVQLPCGLGEERERGSLMTESKAFLESLEWCALRKVTLVDVEAFDSAIVWSLLQGMRATLATAAIVTHYPFAIPQLSLEPDRPEQAFPHLRQLAISTASGLWNEASLDKDMVDRLMRGLIRAVIDHDPALSHLKELSTDTMGLRENAPMSHAFTRIIRQAPVLEHLTVRRNASVDEGTAPSSWPTFAEAVLLRQDTLKQLRMERAPNAKGGEAPVGKRQELFGELRKAGVRCSWSTK